VAVRAIGRVPGFWAAVDDRGVAVLAYPGE